VISIKLINVKFKKKLQLLTSFAASSRVFFSADPSHLSILTGLSVPFCLYYTCRVNAKATTII